MNTLTLKSLRGSLLAVVALLGVLTVSAGVAHASGLHVIDEDDAYITNVSGTFTEDTSCGVRGDCEYVLNDPGPSFSNSKRWNFWNMYCATEGGGCGAHSWNLSDAYVFIPSEHGTTGNAKYNSNFYVYDAVLCPNLCSYNASSFVNQYSYSDAWVAIHGSTATRQFNDTTLNNATGETDNWYVVGWEAAKVEY